MQQLKAEVIKPDLWDSKLNKALSEIERYEEELRIADMDYP